MASGYPHSTAGGNHYHHGHSHSYSAIHLSPGKTASMPFANGNGSLLQSPLFTHTESSRETSPIGPPNGVHNQETQGYFAGENVRPSKHRHNHSAPTMRSSRPRGESNLGKPAQEKSHGYHLSPQSVSAAPVSWFSVPEALTSLLITLPFVLTSAAHSAMSGTSMTDFPPLSRYARLGTPDLDQLGDLEIETMPRHAFIDACILASGSLLIVGIFARLRTIGQTPQKNKPAVPQRHSFRSLSSTTGLQTIATRISSLLLPIYASTLLGGSRVGLILLIATTAGVNPTDAVHGSMLQHWQHFWRSKVGTSSAILLCFIIDELGLTTDGVLSDLILGYLAIAAAMFLLPPHFADSSTASSHNSPKRSPWAPAADQWQQRAARSTPSSTSSSNSYPSVDFATYFTSGAVLALLTVLISTFQARAPVVSGLSLFLITISIAFMAGAVSFAEPWALRGRSKAGLAFGCVFTAGSSFLFSPTVWPGTMCNAALSALSYLGVLYDNQIYVDLRMKDAKLEDHEKSQKQSHYGHHGHDHGHIITAESSALTKALLGRCKPDSLLYGILSEKDSRRIAYFTSLNFGFMLVQGVYGYLSGSLGLLSDTVHMFFDCMGLIVGLGAAIASKWPTSPERPYGWGKLNTLSGFGNGIFLMLVSVEFTWEAIEGMLERRQLRHVNELLVVSILGLLVNMVGLAFFHNHAGHDHDHGHHHAPSHSNGHIHPPNGSLSKDHLHDHLHAHDPAPHSAHSHSHNENLHGIFLHIAADAGGSLAVILSTAANIYRPHFLWDPLATIIIAILIFAAAVPLVKSSGQKLLLVVPEEVEYVLKITLQDLSDLRGVVGYTVPRFWLGEAKGDVGAHVHVHTHGHDHGDHIHHGHYDHDQDHHADEHSGKKIILGVIHIIAEPTADLLEVQERVEVFFRQRNMYLVVQVEREGDECWCHHSGAESD